MHTSYSGLNLVISESGDLLLENNKVVVAGFLPLCLIVVTLSSHHTPAT